MSKPFIPFCVFLALLIASTFPSMVFSQQVPEVATYAFLSVSPNPVGKGQAVSVMFWLDSAPPTAAGALGDRWEGFIVKITKPDGTTETKGPYRSDAVGGAYFQYIPDQVGTYKFQFSFPGQTLYNVAILGKTYPQIRYKASSSRVVELIVQEQPIEPWPDYPLPKGYWTRPINAELREWYKIAGNWLMPAYSTTARAFDTGGAYAPFTQAPESPHILWTRELTFGGIVGGEFGYGESYYTGMSYEMKFTPPVIISGRLYYNDPVYPRTTFYCVDIRTGELIWTQKVDPVSPPPASIGGIFPGNIPITIGQIYNYQSPNQHGSIAYLWSINGPGTEWKMYDAFTGQLMITFKNATSGFLIFGPNGELLCYVFNAARRYILLWNSSKAIPPAWPTGSGAWQWRPALTGTVLDWRKGIQWNVTVPESIPVIPGLTSMNWVAEGVILIETVLAPGEGEATPTFFHAGLSAKDGSLMWTKTWKNMGWGFGGAGRPGLTWSVACPQPREGVYVVFQKETMQWHAFSLKTGDKLWSTEPLNKFTNSDWSMYDVAGLIADGKLYVSGYSGCVNAFDLKTGKHLWTFSIGSSGLETPYESWPLYGGMVYADGKIYVSNGEHSPESVMWRGEKLYCLDAKTGEKIWEMPGWFIGNSIAIADGYLVAYSGYDNRIYCFGKGRTSLEVSASPKVIACGSQILIEGKVADLSPAVKGTPCVADEDMTAWMEYLVQQKPMPEKVKGVSVELYAIDENGQTTYIGSASTDPMNGGLFRKLWTPPKEGTYIITAVFSGTKSYWDGYASTCVGVTAAPEPPTAPIDYTPTLNMLMIIIAVVGLIAIIDLIINLNMSRKLRKQ
ncbi:MAG: PQQ-binding-like beta-propeller repeat protein [Candidatus Bathyarchaeia archaeon]